MNGWTVESTHSPLKIPGHTPWATLITKPCSNGAAPKISILSLGTGSSQSKGGGGGDRIWPTAVAKQPPFSSLTSDCRPWSWPILSWGGSSLEPWKDPSKRRKKTEWPKSRRDSLARSYRQQTPRAASLTTAGCSLFGVCSRHRNRIEMLKDLKAAKTTTTTTVTKATTITTDRHPWTPSPT